MTQNAPPKTAGTPITDMLDLMQKSGFGATPGVGPDWLTKMADMGREMLEFTAARMKHDMQMQQDLLQAKGLAEVQQIQAQFFQKAMEDYAAETSRLMGMGKILVEKPRKYGDVPV